jgi:hypothetical protein
VSEICDIMSRIEAAVQGTTDVDKATGHEFAWSELYEKLVARCCIGQWYHMY